MWCEPSGVRLEPHGEEVEVGRGVGINLRQPFGGGAGDLGRVAEGPLVDTQAVWSGRSTLAAMSGISLTLSVALSHQAHEHQ